MNEWTALFGQRECVLLLLADDRLESCSSTEKEEGWKPDAYL